jgi:D-beta-D-heptose 7-phosphate kinase/D-beta-D-heptose 1-phosphate adenosyltransferase
VFLIKNLRGLADADEVQLVIVTDGIVLAQSNGQKQRTITTMIMTKVVVNGSFDIFHYGHLRLLQFAKSFTNAYVYVLIDSDRRIKQLKGSDRPINTEIERLSLLSELRSVDCVDIFNSDAELDLLIKNFKPDLMVKGSDYKDKPIIGAEHCPTIIFYDRIPTYSTTEKIQSIANRR